MDDIASELHGIARLQVALAKMEGRKINKTLMRFDALVKTALQYGRAGLFFSPEIARSALRKEVVGSCVIGDIDYTGEPAIDYSWMQCSHEPRTSGKGEK